MNNFLKAHWRAQEAENKHSTNVVSIKLKDLALVKDGQLILDNFLVKMVYAQYEIILHLLLPFFSQLFY